MRERLRGARLRKERDGKEAGRRGTGGTGMEDRLPPQLSPEQLRFPGRLRRFGDPRAAAPQGGQALSFQSAQQGCPVHANEAA